MKLSSSLSLLLLGCWLGGSALSGCGTPAGAERDGAVKPAAAKSVQPKGDAAVPEGMVRIPGGTFKMGTDSGWPYEGPVHEVTVKPFLIDAREVTNAQFRKFAEATGYKTVAERWGWSAVFSNEQQQWTKVDGANWRQPLGPGSSIEGKDDYPVVQVCYDDAVVYSKWAGKRLPTEAEWEFAARGGKEGEAYPWGSDLNPKGKYLANYWQDVFPKKDLGRDGYKGIAPTGKYPPNGYGLYDTAGNVWEWVADRYDPEYFKNSPKENPTGPPEGEEFVMKGGSFLCAGNYCSGYRCAARNKATADSAWNHTGFRCVRDL